MQPTDDARRAAHADALKAIRDRVETALCLTRSTMSPDEATALALQAGSEEPDDVKELFALQLDSTRARRGVERAREIGIKPEEVVALFGPGGLVAQGCAVHDSRVLQAVQPVVATEGFCAAERALARALSCTLAERNAKAAWALPSCRLCAYVALHADEDVYIELLGLLVGKVVLTDARRLDDLRSRIAEEGIDAILLNRCAMALGEAASAAV
jgi:hypothetical protein